MEFGDKIRELRKSSNMTQAQLAEAMGISLSMVKKLEQNERETTYRNLVFFSELFNCSIDYLLGKTNNPSPKIEAKNTIELYELLGFQSSIYKKHRIFYNGYELSEDDRSIARKALDLVFRHEISEISEMQRIQNEKHRKERELREEKKYNESKKENQKDTD